MSVLRNMLVLILIAITASCQERKESKVFTAEDIAVIPKPAELILEKGSFQFNDKTQFVISDASQKDVTSVLLDKFKNSEYMIFPRLAALTETLWSSRNSYGWKTL